MKQISLAITLITTTAAHAAPDPAAPRVVAAVAATQQGPFSVGCIRQAEEIIRKALRRAGKFVARHDGLAIPSGDTAGGTLTWNGDIVITTDPGLFKSNRTTTLTWGTWCK